MSEPRKGDEEIFDGLESADGSAASPDAVIAPTRTVKKAPANRSGMFADPVVRRLSWLGALMLVAFLATVVSALFFGILNPPAPRTAVERDLALAEKRIESAETTLTPEDWYQYTTALVASGQYTKAERMIQAARDGGFEDPRKQYLGISEVRLDLAREDWEKALEHADAAMKALEDQRALDQKEFEATQKATSLISEGLGENYDILRLNRVEALEKLGRLDEAIATLDDYLADNPRAADILVWRGDLKVETGDTDGAIEDYKAASAFQPGDEELAKKLKDLGASND